MRTGTTATRKEVRKSVGEEKRRRLTGTMRLENHSGKMVDLKTSDRESLQTSRRSVGVALAEKQGERLT